MALETSAEAPVPVPTVLQAVGGWISKLGRIWVEGQIAECKKRGNTVFLTLRDPIAAVSAQVICTRQVFEVVSPVEGARVVMFVRPDFNATRAPSRSPRSKSERWAWESCWRGWRSYGWS